MLRVAGLGFAALAASAAVSLSDVLCPMSCTVLSCAAVVVYKRRCALQAEHERMRRGEEEKQKMESVMQKQQHMVRLVVHVLAFSCVGDCGPARCSTASC